MKIAKLLVAAIYGSIKVLPSFISSGILIRYVRSESRPPRILS